MLRQHFMFVGVHKPDYIIITAYKNMTSVKSSLEYLNIKLQKITSDYCVDLMTYFMLLTLAILKSVKKTLKMSKNYRCYVNRKMLVYRSLLTMTAHKFL